MTRDPRYHAETLEELEAQDAEHRHWTIGTDSKFRLDKYLNNRIGGISRSQIQKLIALGGVTVNDKPAKPSYQLKLGDEVHVVVPPKPAVDLRPEPIPLDVLYEDDDLIVVNKHAGIIVHPARSYTSGTMVNALAWHLKHGQRFDDETSQADAQERFDKTPDTGLSSVGAHAQRPGVVHRLDMNTTGCIVFAKQDATHWLLAKQFEDRTNLKCYLALVHGNFTRRGVPLSGAIDEPLGKHPTIREGMAARHDHAGKPSLTLYRVRRQYRGFSLVELELKTGRTHQIRVHLSYLGFPIVGDLLYGGLPVGETELRDPPENAPGARPNLTFATPKEEGKKAEAAAHARRDTGEQPLMITPALHAGLLQVQHPVTKEALTFTAPLHDAMANLVHWLEQYGAPSPGITDGTHIDLNAALGK